MSTGPEVQYVPHYEDEDGFTPVRTYGTPYREKKEAGTQRRSKEDIAKVAAYDDRARTAAAPHRSRNNHRAEGISHQPHAVTQHRRRPEQPLHLSALSLPSIIVTVSCFHHTGSIVGVQTDGCLYCLTCRSRTH